MKDKTNIAELLKDCPKGMELDCTMYEGLEFDSIVDNEYLPICCRIKNPDGGYNVYNFTKYGGWLDTTFAKCVIFPKGKTTWEGFVPPCKFKDGDIIAMENDLGIHIFIYNHTTAEYGGYGYYAILTSRGNFKINKFCSGSTYRLANEEEKQKLFKAIKDNGYKWNAETKTLEKLVEPKFKINNIIRHKERKSNTRIVDIKDGNYIFENGDIMPIYLQSDYEFITDKFDINTLKPFKSEVLVRNSYDGFWQPTFWGTYEAEKAKAHLHRHYLTTKGFFGHCIPYNDDTKHLLGTTNDCDDFYKTW